MKEREREREKKKTHNKKRAAVSLTKGVAVPWWTCIRELLGRPVWSGWIWRLGATEDRTARFKSIGWKDGRSETRIQDFIRDISVRLGRKPETEQVRSNFKQDTARNFSQTAKMQNIPQCIPWRCTVKKTASQAPVRPLRKKKLSNFKTSLCPFPVTTPRSPPKGGTTVLNFVSANYLLFFFIFNLTSKSLLNRTQSQVCKYIKKKVLINKRGV